MPHAPAAVEQPGGWTGSGVIVPGMPPEICWYQHFAATTDQLARARAFLQQCLAGMPRTSDAVLCLSELAANAVLHSRSARPGGTFGVRIRSAPGWIRVEVTDAGGPWRPCDADETHGRGLLVVRSLADEVVIGDVGIDSPARTVAFEMAFR